VLKTVKLSFLIFQSFLTDDKAIFFHNQFISQDWIDFWYVMAIIGLVQFSK